MCILIKWAQLTMFTATKLKRAWFSKDKEGGGGMLNLQPMGGKAMCHHPVSFSHLPLSHPNTTFNVCWVVEVVIAGKWWVTGLSVFATRSLHQSSLHLHVGKGTITMPLSWMLSSLSRKDAQGGRFIFLTQSWVKKGCDFMFGGFPFSLYLTVYQSVVVFFPSDHA